MYKYCSSADAALGQIEVAVAAALRRSGNYQKSIKIRYRKTCRY